MFCHRFNVHLPALLALGSPGISDSDLEPLVRNSSDLPAIFNLIDLFPLLALHIQFEELS